jgi:two-component system nitrogen regulation response regulator NtrX
MAGEKILLVDDEVSIIEAITGVLEDEGYCISSTTSGEAALDMIKREIPDLILLDVWLEKMDGLETLTSIRKINSDVAVIMISGHGTIETAVKATQLGALNFIEKPLSLNKLVLEVRQALKHQALERENRDLRLKIDQRYQLIGRSRAMKTVTEIIKTAGPSNARVLISGESGTGKELVAREIHKFSRRVSRAFVEVNCAAIPEDLIESELFGHEKGAFTHAHQKKRGKFELAHDGTLFLDEIGDMSLKTQAKVLRVLEEGKIERVGGNESIKADVRVIAASNKDLEFEMKEGRFREDLFYRLNVIPIYIPPLRERKDDISELAHHFMRDFCSQYGKSVKTFAPDAMKTLESYDWPGNIRELRNEVERLAIMTHGDQVHVSDLRDVFRKASRMSEKLDFPNTMDLKTAREKFEKQYILEALNNNQWNITQTADQLGVERSNLHRKIKLLGIRDSKDDEK